MRVSTLNPKQMAMLSAALVLGMLVSVQWAAGDSRTPALPDQVGRTLDQLELEQTELKEQVGRLRDDLDALQREAVADTNMLADLRAELTQQKVRAGLVDVHGPGVRVTLDDGQLGPSSSPDELLIHDYDLRDAINVLWLAGAEAVAVNDERVVNTTSIYCVGATVVVNDTRQSPPYEIRAIGDPLRMQDHLLNPGYLSELKARSRRFEVRLEFARVDDMTISAYKGSFPQRYVQPGSSRGAQ